MVLHNRVTLAIFNESKRSLLASCQRTIASPSGPKFSNFHQQTEGRRWGRVAVFGVGISCGIAGGVHLKQRYSKGASMNLLHAKTYADYESCMFESVSPTNQGKSRKRVLQDCEDISCIDTKGNAKFHIAIVADLDKDLSKVEDNARARKSYLKKGFLHLENNRFRIEWTEEKEIRGTMLQNGKGYELSDLKLFNGKLYSIDDSTGIVYWMKKNDKGDYEAVPWVILNDGPGDIPKSYKGEWLAVKDGVMYAGSHGREWMTPQDGVLHKYKMWVKTIDEDGAVKNLDWIRVYDNMRSHFGLEFPGYLTHEAVCWSKVRRTWNFLPRKMCPTAFRTELDENSCTNVMVSCNEHFQDWKVTHIGDLQPTKGFSAFNFVPGTNEEIAIAIKSTEVGDEQHTDVMVFNVDGTVLLNEYVAPLKYEGVEISCKEL